jgi:hypothetical protein
MNKIFNNPQQAAASKMNEMPQAAEWAEKLIYSRPDLFTGSLEETKIVIALVMVNFGIACNKFIPAEVNSDNLIDTIIGIVKDDAKNRLGINLDLKPE